MFVKLLKFYVFPLAVACGLCWPLNQAAAGDKSKTIDASSWKAHLAGRYLIDLPPDAKMEVYTEEILGQPIVWRKDLTPQAASKEAAAKTESYKKVKPYKKHPEMPPNMLIETVTLANGGLGVYHWEKLEQGYSMYGADLDCYFVTPDKKRVFFYIYPVGKSHLSEAKPDMVELAKAIRSREDGEYPPEPGFCFRGGFISPTHFTGPVRGEGAILHIVLPAYPGLFIVFQAEVVGKDEEFDFGGGLLGAFDRESGSKTIRHAKRRFHTHPRKASEFCQSFAAESHRGREYECRLHLPGEYHETQPTIFMSMRTAERVPNNPWEGQKREVFDTPAEFLALWDAITASVRLRPGETVKK